MNTFWLYLEPFTFLWHKKDKGIIYNSVSYQVIEFHNTGLVQDIVKELLNINNLYCIEITEKQLSNKGLNNLVSSITQSNSGGLVRKNITHKKPVIIPPYPRVFLDKDYITKENTLAVNENLIGLNIFINGDCELDCTLCSSMYKQVLHCTKSDHYIGIDLLENIFTQIAGYDLTFINLLGGNISKYNEIENLIDLIAINNKLTFNLYIDFRNISVNFLKYFENINNCVLTICFHASSLEKINNNQIFRQINCINYKFICYLENRNEYDLFNSFLNKYNIEEFSFIPINANNVSFKEMVSISKEELNNVKLTRREVFVNKTLNSNSFGVLNILANCNVYTNLNLEPIGSIRNDEIKYLVYKSFNDSSSWFLTRDKVVPCKDCIYCYLCPPPSNYEINSGDYKICNVT